MRTSCKAILQYTIESYSPIYNLYMVPQAVCLVKLPIRDDYISLEAKR